MGMRVAAEDARANHEKRADGVGEVIGREVEAGGEVLVECGDVLDLETGDGGGHEVAGDAAVDVLLLLGGIVLR